MGIFGNKKEDEVADDDTQLENVINEATSEANLVDDADLAASQFEEKQPDDQTQTQQTEETQEQPYANINSADDLIHSMREQLGPEKANELLQGINDQKVKAEAAERFLQDPRAQAALAAQGQAGQQAQGQGQPYYADPQQQANQTYTSGAVDIPMTVELDAFNAALETGDKTQIATATQRMLQQTSQATEQKVIHAVSSLVNPMMQNVQQNQRDAQYATFVGNGHPELDPSNAKYDQRVRDSFFGLCQSGKVTDWQIAYDVTKSQLGLTGSESKVSKGQALAANQVAKTSRAVEPATGTIETVEEAYEKTLLQVAKQ